MFDLSRAALHRAIALSCEVEVQLRTKERTSPLLALLAKAQEAAAEALIKMADVDAEDPKAIRELQTDLRCFDRILLWLKEIVAAGFEADQVLSIATREELAEDLGLTEDQAEDVLNSGLPPTED